MFAVASLLCAFPSFACERAAPWVEAAFIEAKHAVQLLGHPFPGGVRLCAVTNLPGAAFTLPGELQVSPDWAESRSPGAVRFILAHELGHQLQYAGLMTVFEVGVSLAWTREYQADSLAAEALRKAGHDPLLAAREAFESFDLADDRSSATHPPWRDRLAALQR